jgi:hypothetical protein
MTVDASEDEVAEFDEKHQEWLMRQDLELYALFCLAHMISPRWPIRRPDL